MKDFEIRRDREFLMKRMGDISQLAGAKRYELLDGKAKGVEAVDIKTGTGLEFTVLPGRGMDIAWAGFRGVPVSYISKTGIVSPAYYESDGMNWLRSFFAGLLTTCGLSNVGGPCEEEDELLGMQKYGLHGRISNSAADNVCVSEEWQDNDYIITVSGRLRESVLHGENLSLRRVISAKMGENRLTVRDVVENEGFKENPLMLLYHINFGYPILDDGSRLVCSSADITPNDSLARGNLDIYDAMNAPEKGARENLYFHDLNAAGDGTAYAGLINERLELGAYVKFNKAQLPKLAQWKQLSEAEYVLGIEPSNCYPVGRVEQRKRGGLEYLKPGEKRVFELEIGLLTDLKQITEFEGMAKSRV